MPEEKTDAVSNEDAPAPDALKKAEEEKKEDPDDEWKKYWLDQIDK